MELTLILFATMSTEEIMQRLIEARKKKNLTQTDIANELNISQVQYGKYENGVSDLSLSKFLELLKILDVDIADFSDTVNQSKEELLTFIEKQERALKLLKEKINPDEE